MPRGRRNADWPRRMPKDRFALLLPRLTLPTGFEAYKASGRALPVWAETDSTVGTEGPCRVCLTRCLEGDRAFHISLRRIGSSFADRTVALVHEACVPGGG